MVKGIESYINTLEPAMQEKIRKCSSIEEIFGVARREGLELPEDALDAVYGGCGDSYTYETDAYYRCKIHKQKTRLMSVGHDGWPNVYYCDTCLTTKGQDEVEWHTERNRVRK